MDKATGKAQLHEVEREARAALALLDQETADALIGEQTEEYRTLIRAVQAVKGLEWGLLKTHGLREKAALAVGAKTLAMLLTLIHYAYALGIRRGRELAAQE